MKLLLVNFRCFDRKEFIFNELFTLLSGVSGCGKTTVFMAISFAINGEGKKITKRGKKTCIVELLLDDHNITIRRTKGPCRLIVKYNDKEYEDNSGQAIIDKLYPRWDLGYVSQRMYKSFVMMTPVEKLRYIEKIAFNDNNLSLDDIHKRCRELLSIRKSDLSKSKYEKETIQNITKSLIGIDILSKNDELFDETKSSAEVLVDYDNLVSKYTEQKKNLEESINVIRLRKETLKMLEKDLLLLTKYVDDNKDVISKFNNEHDFNTVCDFIEELIEIENNWERYAKSLSKLNDYKVQYDNFKQSLTILIDDINEVKINEEINELQRINSLDNKIKDLSFKKLQLEKLIKSKESLIVKFECPLCFQPIGLYGDNMISIDENKQFNISTNNVISSISNAKRLEKEINDLDKEIILMDSIAKEVYEYSIGKNVQERLKELQELQRNIKCINTYRSNIEIYEKECEYQKCFKPEILIKPFVGRIKEIRNKRTLIADKNKQIEELQLILSKNDYEQQLRDDLNNIDTKLVAVKNNYDNFKCKSYVERVKELSTIESDNEQSIVSMTKLQQLITTAEKIALNKTIETINDRVELYNRDFFTDETYIDSKLVFDDNKISIIISQQDNNKIEETDILSLSGGELARIIISFALAIAELNNVKLMMLDESVSSLDSYTTSSVINSIKNNFNGKVICVAHQTTTGVFDKVFEL